MECWAASLGDREAVAKFPVTDLGFKGCFSAGLDTEIEFLSLLNFSLSHW
jgi:hypothetical protein